MSHFEIDSAAQAQATQEKGGSGLQRGGEMIDYKLVPLEPTPEMVEAAEDAYMPFGDMEMAIRLALLAAPAVQGEPVAWIRKWSLDGEKPSKERNKSGRMALPMKFKLHEVTRNRCLPDDVALYTAPQPTEQTEPVGWQFYDNGKWWYGDDRIKLHRKNTEAAGIPVRDIYAAPQPTPDVTALVEALESAKNLIANHSGEVLPDEYAGDQIEQIDAALAAHFKRDSQPYPAGYAGATVWIGDKRVTQVVTEGSLKHESEPGMVITHAAQACLDLLAAAHRKQGGKV